MIPIGVTAKRLNSRYAPLEPEYLNEDFNKLFNTISDQIPTMVRVPPISAANAIGNSIVDLSIPVLMLIRFTIGINNATVPSERMKLADNPAAVISNHKIFLG